MNDKVEVPMKRGETNATLNDKLLMDSRGQVGENRAPQFAQGSNAGELTIPPADYGSNLSKPLPNAEHRMP